MNKIKCIGLFIGLLMCFNVTGCSTYIAKQVVYDESHLINGRADDAQNSLVKCQDGQKEECAQVEKDLKSISDMSQKLMDKCKVN